MAIILQAVTGSGVVVEGARWEVEFPAGVQEGHSVALSLRVLPKEVHLLNYLSRNTSADAQLDKGPDGISVAVACKISRVRHMVETQDGTVSTMCYVVPVSRLSEHVMTYLLMPAKCDSKFLRMVRGGVSDPAAG